MTPSTPKRLTGLIGAEYENTADAEVVVRAHLLCPDCSIARRGPGFDVRVTNPDATWVEWCCPDCQQWIVSFNPLPQRAAQPKPENTHERVAFCSRPVSVRGFGGGLHPQLDGRQGLVRPVGRGLLGRRRRGDYHVRVLLRRPSMTPKPQNGDEGLPTPNKIADYVDATTGELLFSIPFVDTDGCHSGRPFKPGDPCKRER